MIVCHCKAVNERGIAEVVAAGARCTEDVMRACGAAGRCGGCRPLVEEIVAKLTADERAARVGAGSAA